MTKIYLDLKNKTIIGGFYRKDGEKVPINLLSIPRQAIHMTKET